jgi:hypothetical protein
VNVEARVSDALQLKLQPRAWQSLLLDTINLRYEVLMQELADSLDYQ